MLPGLFSGLISQSFHNSLIFTPQLPVIVPANQQEKPRYCVMKKPYKTTIILYAALAFLITAPAFAGETVFSIPFGGYSKNGKCGFYGSKVPITSVEEARKVIEEFIVGHDLRIGAIEEHPSFFRAELIDGNGAVQDVVIFNKVNGRIRSAY